jgi:hypothetical protein
MGEQMPPMHDTEVLGMTRAAIETAVAQNGKYKLGLAVISSSSRQYELETKQFGQTVDDLLLLFGVDGQAATERLVSVVSNYSKSVGWKTDEQQLAEARQAGLPLGSLLHDFVLEAMPIEDEDDGEGEAQITVRLTDSLTVELHGFGDFWTARTYKHPGTGQLLRDGSQSVVIDALIASGQNPEIVASKVAFDMAFDARFRVAETE